MGWMLRLAQPVVGIAVGLVGAGACTSFGTSGDDTSDGSVVVAGDGSVLRDGAVLPPNVDDAAVARDATSNESDGGDAAAPCRPPRGAIDATYGLAPLPLVNAVAVYEPSADKFYVAGSETCDASGFARIGLYEVGGATSKRIACFGDPLETAVVVDADAAGIALATHYPHTSGFRAARLHRLASNGTVRAPAVNSPIPTSRSYFPTGVARLGARDAWSFYLSTSSPLNPPVEGTIRVEGVTSASLGESIVVAMNVLREPTGARITTIEAYQGSDARTDKVLVADWIYASASGALVRDPNRQPLPLPSSAPTTTLQYGQGSLAVTPAMTAAGFSASANSYAGSRNATSRATFTVGPHGTSSLLAPVALTCDGALLVGYGAGQEGYLARHAAPLADRGHDPTFVPKVARAPSQLFVAADGRVYVFLSGPDARLVRLEK